MSHSRIPILWPFLLAALSSCLDLWPFWPSEDLNGACALVFSIPRHEDPPSSRLDLVLPWCDSFSGFILGLGTFSAG